MVRPVEYCAWAAVVVGLVAVEAATTSKMWRISKPRAIAVHDASVVAVLALYSAIFSSEAENSLGGAVALVVGHYGGKALAKNVYRVNVTARDCFKMLTARVLMGSVIGVGLLAIGYRV